MTMESLIKRFSVDDVLNGWIGQAAATAENCVRCGECEEKCPYNLEIADHIQRGAAAFAALQRNCGRT